MKNTIKALAILAVLFAAQSCSDSSSSTEGTGTDVTVEQTAPAAETAPAATDTTAAPAAQDTTKK